MTELPFDKWSLNFQNKDFEEIYEKTQNQKRLRILRVMSSGLAIVALSCLILFIIQLQPAFLIFEMGAAFGGCSLTIIISGKLVPYLKQAFVFFYILCVGTTIIINYSGIYVPHYVYGYCTSLLYVSILQYCHNPLKLVFIVITPCLNLGLFGVFDINYLQYILLTATAVVLLGFLTYQIEYTSRLSFSQTLLLEKQREILHDCTSQPLFSMILNERSNSLNISFQNKKFLEFLNLDIKQFDIDQVTIKEFLRSTFVTAISEEYQLIEFIQRKGKENEKVISLEDFLFQRLTLKEGNIKNKWQEDNLIMMRKSDTQIFELQIRKMNYIKPQIFVQIHQDKLTNKQTQFQEQEREYSKMITKISKKMADSQEQFLKEITNLQQSENNVNQKKFQTIQCCCISIIAKLKNYILFFSQNRISQLQTIDVCKLHSILNSIQPYFHCRTNQNSRQFKQLNTVSNQQEIKVNSKILIQLIINVQEIALKYSLKKDTIFFKIQIKSEILKQQQSNHTSPDIYKQTEVGKSQDSYFNQIVQFSFSFMTVEKFDLISKIPQSGNQLILEEHQIAYKVSTSLLGMIGPYNHNEMVQTQLEDKSFYNTLMFEIYQDQTKLEQSFVKFNIKQ